MEKLKVKIVCEKPERVPKYATELSAGFDLYADSVILGQNTDPTGFQIQPNSRILIGTGVFIELPKGKALDIRTRSGTALKQGVFVLNSPGTVDADYRGEVGVILHNTTSETVQFKFGERIAQGVIIDYYQAEFEVVTELSDTVRGTGGFGHTGK